jgi:hypothetical protein
MVGIEKGYSFQSKQKNSEKGRPKAGMELYMSFLKLSIVGVGFKFFVLHHCKNPD